MSSSLIQRIVPCFDTQVTVVKYLSSPKETVSAAKIWFSETEASLMLTRLSLDLIICYLCIQTSLGRMNYTTVISDQ